MLRLTMVILVQPLETRCFTNSFDILPAPMMETRTFSQVLPGSFICASSAAADETDTAPVAMLVSLRTRLPAVMACMNRADKYWPKPLASEPTWTGVRKYGVGWGGGRASFEQGGGGGEEGVLDRKLGVPKMARPDFPYCKFRFFPLWSLWSGEGGRGFWGRGPPPPWFLIQQHYAGKMKMCTAESCVHLARVQINRFSRATKTIQVHLHGRGWVLSSSWPRSDAV